MQLTLDKGHPKLNYCYKNKAIEFLPSSNFSEQEIIDVHILDQSIQKKVRLKNGTDACITDTFCNAENGIEWTVTIETQGKPFTIPFEQSVKVLGWPDCKFFTTCGGTDNPELGEVGIEKATDASANGIFRKTFGWSDPLKPQLLQADTYFYGAPYYEKENQRIGLQPTNPKVFTMPFYTLINQKIGLSVLQNLDDTILDAVLNIADDGQITYKRIHHRFGEENSRITFHCFLLFSSADVRNPLNYYLQKYPQYFNAHVPMAEKAVGCCSYSSLTNPTKEQLDEYKTMGYHVNWNAAFDFPYIGLYLPPVKSETESWTNYYKTESSIKKMRENAAAYQNQDCYLLNYFNIAELGQNITYPFPAVTTKEDERWKNCNDFIQTNFKDAVLLSPCDNEIDEQNGIFHIKKDQPYFSWYDCIALDCGEKNYKDFLIHQAYRLCNELPETAGIAIDRGDWVRLYNMNADDSVSMIDNEKCRSLILSYHMLMEELSRTVHNYNKVIYLNNHVKRLDLLKEIDGIFDEFGSNDISINLSALLSTQTPCMGWLSEDSYILNNQPDGYFQRYLYLGMHPMVPIIGNDHALTHSEKESYFKDYGALFELMRGRKWILTPDCIEVEDAKANLFSIPTGFMVPVVLGKKETANLQLSYQALSNKKLTLLYPGGQMKEYKNTADQNGLLTINVPLIRGCCILYFH